MNIEFPTLADTGASRFNEPEFETLDLSDNAVAAFWKNNAPNQLFYPALVEMDSKETWAQRAFHDVGVLNDLDVILDDLRTPSIEDNIFINRLDDLFLIMGYLKASQALRLLYWIERERPHLNEQILRRLIDTLDNQNETENGYFLPEALLLHRLRSLKQLVLMQRIFDENRMNRVNGYFAAFEQAEYPETQPAADPETGALNTGIKVA